MAAPYVLEASHALAQLRQIPGRTRPHQSRRKQRVTFIPLWGWTVIYCPYFPAHTKHRGMSVSDQVRRTTVAPRSFRMVASSHCGGSERGHSVSLPRPAYPPESSGGSAGTFQRGHPATFILQDELDYCSTATWQAKYNSRNLSNIATLSPPVNNPRASRTSSYYSVGSARLSMCCPQCLAEYREGFTECADCRLPLAPGPLPQPARPPAVELVTVMETGDTVALNLARTSLE